MARRSGEAGPETCRPIAGAMTGDVPDWSSRVFPLLVGKGEGTAAWRRREGARCRWGNLGEGSPMGGSGGLLDEAGL
jgi:hypothetical protein